MTEREFEAIAEAALRELPAEVRDRLANVPILVEDLPSEALIREGTDPRLLGLFSGVPLPDKTHEGQIPALDTIHLFQRNLERAARGRDHLAEEIRITVLHETAHYFGLDDDDLHRLGLG
jgi:predicted Zn-dependent protease with MMP-like domain